MAVRYSGSGSINACGAQQACVACPAAYVEPALRAMASMHHKGSGDQFLHRVDALAMTALCAQRIALKLTGRSRQGPRFIRLQRGPAPEARRADQPRDIRVHPCSSVVKTLRWVRHVGAVGAPCRLPLLGAGGDKGIFATDEH
jgi:hypothetical protein